MSTRSRAHPWFRPEPRPFDESCARWAMEHDGLNEWVRWRMVELMHARGYGRSVPLPAPIVAR